MGKITPASPWGDFVRIVSTGDEQEHPGIWMHTRGVRKFGRPDLQVKHVPGPWPGDNPMVSAAGEVLNRLAGGLCRGAVIRGGGVRRFPGTRRRCTLVSPDPYTPNLSANVRRSS